MKKLASKDKELHALINCGYKVLVQLLIVFYDESAKLLLVFLQRVQHSLAKIFHLLEVSLFVLVGSIFYPNIPHKYLNIK